MMPAKLTATLADIPANVIADARGGVSDKSTGAITYGEAAIGVLWKKGKRGAEWIVTFQVRPGTPVITQLDDGWTFKRIAWAADLSNAQVPT